MTYEERQRLNNSLLIWGFVGVALIMAVGRKYAYPRDLSFPIDEPYKNFEKEMKWRKAMRIEGSFGSEGSAQSYKNMMKKIKGADKICRKCEEASVTKEVALARWRKVEDAAWRDLD